MLNLDIFGLRLLQGVRKSCETIRTEALREEI